MNTKALINNAIGLQDDGSIDATKAIKFKVDHLDTDADNKDAQNKQVDKVYTDAVTASTDPDKKIGLTAEMLDKFYGQAGATSALSTLDTDNAPTAADFAALNAFAKSALKTVSQQRSDLGAVQNRLEHTINNLDNVVENTTSAESQIRDTDMATEMVKYSNNNILAQAGQAMLAQANQSNQGVLSLLG